MNIKISQPGLFHGRNRAAQNVGLYRNRSVQNTSLYGNRMKNTQGADGMGGAQSGDVRLIRRMLSRQTDQNNPYKNASCQNPWYSGNIVDETLSYADSIREKRMKTQNTNLQVKKLQYSFKAISTQILRSKTSVQARQVAGKARREVIRLKRQRQGGESPDQELECAILHAQAMERVAKKKVRHLLEEEMVKVTGGPCEGELEEMEDQKGRLMEEALEDALAGQMSPDGSIPGPGEDMAEAVQEQMQAYEDMMQTQTADFREMQQEMQWLMEEMAAKLQEKTADSMGGMMSDFMEGMSDSMEEMLENMGLSELAESAFGTVEVEMDPADYKMMKIKHRSEELRAIAKADAEYLKAVFERLEEAKSSPVQAILGSGSNPAVPAGGQLFLVGDGKVAPMQGIDIVSAPGDSMPVPPADGSFDISV